MDLVIPTNGMCITKAARLQPGIYCLPDGIRIEGNGFEVDCEGVTIIGSNREGVGVRLYGVADVKIRGLSARDYYFGVRAENCTNCTFENCNITSTSEVAANTIFLDIWLTAENAYGGAIILVGCKDCTVNGNDFQHQMNGILTYFCERLRVTNNLCNYNSGFGIHLYNSCDSEFIENSCDYCCRFEPRSGGGPHFGHMGADATGFLAVMNSCRNKFLRNKARMGGDGFFLAGLSPDGIQCGCNDNVFEENDASLSPNISFESTFCENNVYRNNLADRSAYGFWCGYSKGFEIRNNRMLYARQAGIAVENGVGFQVSENEFQSCGHGILMWSRRVPEFEAAYPDRDTCREWLIEKNSFLKNWIGIRIAADQDHGIRDLPLEQWGADLHPANNVITHNNIQNNRIGIELLRAGKNRISENTLNGNVEANLVEKDSEESEIVNNMGARGAYL